jgi:hypothetical protein
MKTFRTFITALVVLAVAGSPLTAMAMPCCCTQPVETKRSCCPVKKPAAAEPAACCAKKQAAPLVQLRSECCCVKALPASTLASEKSTQSSPQNSPVEVAYLPADRIFPAASAGDLQHSVGERRLSGPPLLARYCIWLK